jgi:hypothetical protein
MAVYFRDFKEYIQEFIRRNKQIKFNSGSEFKKILEFNRNMSEDVCQFQLNDLQQCVNSADKILNSKSRLTGTEQFIVNVCHNNVATHWLTHDKSKLKINSQLRVDVTRNWQKLFSHILKHKLKLKVIKLPEHKMFEYLLAPSDTDELISDILSKFEGNPNFEILDLTHVIKSKKESQQCKFFYDPLHYNNLSKSIITQKIIESFPVYSPQNNDAKADLIKKNHFE